MQDRFREHQILKKVLVVQLPRHLEFLEVLILLRKKKIRLIVRANTVSKCRTANTESPCGYTKDKLTRVSRKLLMVRAA